MSINTLSVGRILPWTPSQSSTDSIGLCWQFSHVGHFGPVNPKITVIPSEEFRHPVPLVGTLLGAGVGTVLGVSVLPECANQLLCRFGKAEPGGETLHAFQLPGWNLDGVVGILVSVSLAVGETQEMPSGVAVAA